MAVERRISTLVLSLGCHVALGLAAASLYGAGSASVLVAGFVVCQGAGIGVTSIMRPVIIADLLGRKDFGVISGLLAIPYMGGYALGPTMAALFWEAGGYDLVLLVAMAMAVIGFLALLAAFRSP